MLPLGATPLRLRGAAEKGSHTGPTSTENSDPENKFAMYHRHKCHLHHVMLPETLTVSASFWI